MSVIWNHIAQGIFLLSGKQIFSELVDLIMKGTLIIPFSACGTNSCNTLYYQISKVVSVESFIERHQIYENMFIYHTCQEY